MASQLENDSLDEQMCARLNWEKIDEVVNAWNSMAPILKIAHMFPSTIRPYDMSKFRSDINQNKLVETCGLFDLLESLIAQ